MKVPFVTLFDPRTRTDGQGQNHENAHLHVITKLHQIS
jgi:hypothetical protein